MLENFSVWTSQSIFLRSSASGGLRCSEANLIANSRLLVCLMYVTM